MDTDRPDATPGSPSRPGTGDRLGPYELADRASDVSPGLRFRAVDTRTAQERLLEWFGPESEIDPERLVRETEVLAGLRHPNILLIHDSGTASGGHYAVFEGTCGIPLSAWIDRDRPEVRTIAGMFAALARAIGHLRKRGLSLGRFEGDHVLVELDGTARLLRYPGLPPAETTAAEDMMALGRALSAALSIARDDAPPGIREIVARCLRPDSDDAYLDLTELASDLTSWNTVRFDGTKNETTRVMLQKIRRKRRIQSAAAAIGAAIVLGTAFAIVSGHLETTGSGGPDHPVPKRPADTTEPADAESARRSREALTRAEEIEGTQGASEALAFLERLLAEGAVASGPLGPRRARLRWTVLSARAARSMEAGRFEDALRDLESEPSFGIAEFDGEKKRLSLLGRTAVALRGGDARLVGEGVSQYLRAGGRLDLLFRSLSAAWEGDPAHARAALLALEPPVVQILSRALLQISEDSRQDAVVLDWLERLQSAGDARWLGALVRIIGRRPDPVRLAAANALAECAGPEGETRIADALAPLGEPDGKTVRERLIKAARVSLESAREAFYRHDFPAAAKFAERAVRLSPADPDPLLLRADLRLEAGRLEEAAADVRAAGEMEGPTPDLLLRLARTHRAFERLAEAATAIERAIAADPVSGDVALESGIVLYHLRRFQDAGRETDRAYGLLVESGRVVDLAICRTWQARSRHQVGNHGEAVRLATEATSLDPGNALPHAVLALALLDLGQRPQAADAAGVSLSMAETAVGLYVRGRLGLEEGASETALADLLRAEAIARCDRPEIRLAAARAHLALGSIHPAIEMLERAADEAPDLPGVAAELKTARARLPGKE